MTRDDEEAILALFAKLAEAEAKAPKRDPEAERLIAAGLARQPEAAYRMAQVLIVQDQALQASAQRIKFALNNTHVIDFAMKQGGFSGYGLQGFV